MSATSQETPQAGCCGVHDCVKIFRVFQMARGASKIALALTALVLTLAWGSLLDAMWVKAGGGVAPGEIRSYSIDRDVGVPYGPQSGDSGIYAQYSAHMRAQVYGLCGSVIPGGDMFGSVSGFVQSFGGMCRATTWLVRYHPWFALLFCPVMLLIWSLSGGMICRIAAVEFARDEVISLKDAFAFVRKRYFDGFVMAPLAPLLILAVVAVLLALGGLVLSIPVLGDFLGGLFFFLALLGGLIGAILLIGFSAGGSLFWPAIAAEGTTTFDAFSTSFHYVYTRPWRSALYGLVAFLYGSVCWLFVHFLAHVTLLFTHTFVGLGTVAHRTAETVKVSKLDALWSYQHFLGEAHNWMSEAVSGADWLGAVLIGMWVCLVVALVWAFLVSFYFCASTVIYFLLRRAVDLTDYERVEEVEEYTSEEASPPQPVVSEPPPAPEPAPARAAEPPAAPVSPPWPSTDQPPPDAETPPQSDSI